MNHNLWTAYEAAAATGGMLCVRGGGDGAGDGRTKSEVQHEGACEVNKGRKDGLS